MNRCDKNRHVPLTLSLSPRGEGTTTAVYFAIKGKVRSVEKSVLERHSPKTNSLLFFFPIHLALRDQIFQAFFFSHKFFQR
jgi:hypothetical protein